MKKTVGLAAFCCAMLLSTSTYADDNHASLEDFKELADMFKGRWIGEVTWVTDWPGLGKKGDKVTCYLDVSSTADGNALVGHFYGGSGSSTILWMYDAGAKQIKATMVDSGGTTDSITYHKKDGKWIEAGQGSLANGTKTKYQSTLAFDGKTLVAKGGGTVGGEPMNERHDIWTKVH